MAKKKVVLTGASGYVAGRMLPALRERYDLTLLDVKTTNREGDEVEGVQVVDLENPDRDAYRAHFRGADAVVHSGFKGTVNWSHTDYWKESDNIRMCYNVYQTCVEEGVKRIVVMSSNHACDFYERLIWSDRLDFATTDMLPLSDNFYGWAKSSYEHLSFVFATGNATNGKRLESVHIRIGAPRDTIMEGQSADDLKQLHRELGAYLSARDLSQLVIKSLEAENIEDENGVPFQVFFGISGNTHRFWNIDNARRVVGYAPEDDSQIRFAGGIAEIIQEAQKKQ
ncbi:MAG: NAD(P)-dependent oxidoreductase [Gemmatimonadota bacterium]|nr:NAD(P)-dependent oxidoreductase [Gemmatimonadota bacterium]MDE2830626.1 NAD(P)-dependent oxidoreductase [Gemmatimonadota bacterium]